MGVLLLRAEFMYASYPGSHIIQQLVWM